MTYIDKNISITHSIKTSPNTIKLFTELYKKESLKLDVPETFLHAQPTASAYFSIRAIQCICVHP